MTLPVTCGRNRQLRAHPALERRVPAVFTRARSWLFLIQGSGNTAALQLVLFRLVQGVGGAFLFANSTAILIDAFPATERGLAIGINQVAAIGGSFVGLLLGGRAGQISSAAVFLISIPFGILGTVWAYLMLHETGREKGGQRHRRPGQRNPLRRRSALLLIALPTGWNRTAATPWGGAAPSSSAASWSGWPCWRRSSSSSSG